MPIVVVLPAPFGPRSPKASPCATRNERLSTALREPYDLQRASTMMASTGGSMAQDGADGRVVSLRPMTDVHAGGGAPPTSIGPYKIEREIGRGGMGVVYLARDSRLDRRVALKALPVEVAADPDRLARFEREAKILAQISHPNVAAIYDVEEVGGARYLALEYIEGESLAERLSRGPLPLAEALDLCQQIAAGMEAAHEGGIIHRDLKPGNVVIAAGDVVKVVDFGL